ncbi:hypothetical protein DFR79_1452 [Halanaerobium saccharolyticum]|uniref:Uncharacterized protein n=1 Tax=Halanaerobium saccharolyticum TaxID=43595 RepID=A0A4R6LCT9_9FIRM|nr:hypothetical protein [Halanaerobium saccharolyticum]TDO71611.1 hypothetical protein DFR79_1452 [Halanaerobium saccharolyticum]
MNDIKVSDVFGVRKEMVLSYIERENVDGKFENALESDRHIVIYGSSKQGKSALVQKHISEDKMISIGCGPKMSTQDIYKSLLRQIGIKIETSQEKTQNSSGEVTVKTSIKALLPFGQAKAEAGAKISEEDENKVSYSHIEFNLEIAQDISELLDECNFDKLIIIENFHYLDEEEQKTLAFDLRHFQEKGYKFIILGIWREKNRLIQFNGDLLDRITEIPVEPWENKDFDFVIEKGSEILNINFSEEIIAEMKDISFGNIGILQELCKETCLAAEITEKCDDHNTIKNNDYFEKAIEIKVYQYSSRHLRVLESIADAGKKYREGLFMPYYLVIVIIQSDIDDLKDGISRRSLTDKIREIHYRGEDVRSSDISYLLHNLAESQSKKKIIPPLFDYDRVNRRLRIIDTSLTFFLNFENSKEIIEVIPDPTENIS